MKEKLGRDIEKRTGAEIMRERKSERKMERDRDRQRDSNRETRDRERKMSCGEREREREEGGTRILSNGKEKKSERISKIIFLRSNVTFSGIT